MIILSIISILLLGLSIYLFIPYWKHKTAIKRFHSYYLKEENKPELEVVYVDKMGNKWYRAKSLMQYPTARMEAAETAGVYSELCMSPDYFAQKLIELRELHKDSDRVREIAIDLQQKSSKSATRITLQYLAHALYMLDGENPINPTKEFLKKKLEIWQRDPECEGFFLHMALGHTRVLDGLSRHDLMRSLIVEESKEVFRQISHF